METVWNLRDQILEPRASFYLVLWFSGERPWTRTLTSLDLVSSSVKMGITPSSQFLYGALEEGSVMGLECYLARRKLICQLLLLLLLSSHCYYYLVRKYYSVVLWHSSPESKEQQIGWPTGCWLLRRGAGSRWSQSQLPLCTFPDSRLFNVLMY